MAATANARVAETITFPTFENGSTFFPFEDWSGYYTSRPLLKGLSQRVHTALAAAEQLFGLHGGALNASAKAELFGMLESARRYAAIYQVRVSRAPWLPLRASHCF